MSRRRRRTATAIIGGGTPRLPRRLDCECAVSSVRDTLAGAKIVDSYVFSLILKKIFLFKCNLSMLRLTAMLSLLALPVVLTPLIAYHKRERPPSSLTTPLLEAVILASFPLAWFYGFLYYTEVPSLVSVLSSVVLASQGKHWLAALVRFDSSECHFGGRFTEDKRGS